MKIIQKEINLAITNYLSSEVDASIKMLIDNKILLETKYVDKASDYQLANLNTEFVNKHKIAFKMV